MEEIIKDKSLMEHTRSVKELLGLRVLSRSGEKIGAVKDVRYSLRAMNIKGIFTRHPKIGNLYIGSDYIEIISKDSILLSIDPAILNMNKKVITHQGKVLGKVKKIERVGNTNIISKMHIRRFLHKAFVIKLSDIGNNGDSIILKEGRHEQK
ncbi:hypothetical protein AUJ84_03420 [Candidatus Pacearchaeota archaeon CG1_02_32_132]|nr:MAG: hypothetical protein AUJ84_03420 [Candidatus Pacearchaeota archaeon CG1_02_32_132]